MNQYQKQSRISIAFSFRIGSRGKSPFPTPFLFMDTFKILFQAFWLFIRSELTQPALARVIAQAGGDARLGHRRPRLAHVSLPPALDGANACAGDEKEKGFLVGFTGSLFVKMSPLIRVTTGRSKEKVL